MSGLAPGGDVLELPDWEFQEQWGGLNDDERSAIGNPGFERYRRLRPWVMQSIEDAERGNAFLDAERARRAEITPAVITSNLIDWPALTGEPPAFPWILDHWLSWHPTLLAGRGGIGKSLLIQQVLTALATGGATWCAAHAPLKVLYWACEDDLDQLWRRQTMICRRMQLGFDRLENFFVDARYGLDNTLMASDYGKPMWTPRIELLRQQVNDLEIDVLALDNLGHTFGANENVRHDVTMFLNGIAGLVSGRRFCPIVLGHPAKGIGSEYSGSTAWENAVRMRWYLDDKLPDQKGEAETPDPDYRVLSKRKTNYTKLDYIQFKFDSGVLVPEEQEQGEPGIIKTLRARRAHQVVLDAIANLSRRNIYGTNKSGRHYLPFIMLENGIAEGYSKAELSKALSEMIYGQELEESEVGRNAARKPIIGLRVRI